MVEKVAADDVVAVAGEAAAGRIAPGPCPGEMVADRLHPPCLVLRGGAPEQLQVLRLRRRAPLLAAPVHARHPLHQFLLQVRPHLLNLHLTNNTHHSKKTVRSSDLTRRRTCSH